MFVEGHSRFNFEVQRTRNIDASYRLFPFHQIKSTTSLGEAQLGIHMLTQQSSILGLVLSNQKVTDFLIDCTIIALLYCRADY